MIVKCISVAIGLTILFTAARASYGQTDSLVTNDAIDNADNQQTALQVNKHQPMIPTSHSIEMFEKRVSKNNLDYSSRLVLGQLYLRRAKENDEFQDFILAEQQFRQAISSRPNHSPAKSLLAMSLLDQHRFKEAHEISTELLKENPDSVISLATNGDACIQLGDFEIAKRCYDRMLELSASPAAMVRLVAYHELIGEIQIAKRLMSEAVVLQVSLGNMPEADAWYLWRQAKLLYDSGEAELAKKKLAGALELRPEYAQAIAMLARIESFVGSKNKAVKFFKRAIALSEEPPLLVSLGDLLIDMGEDEQAVKYFSKAEALMNTEAKDPAAGPAHARERATYFLDHDKNLKLALEMALGDLNHRSDPYSHDTVAWAYYKNGKMNEARYHSKLALAQNTADAKLLFHSGMIEMACGDMETGKLLLEQALKCNPYFSVRDVALIQQELGQYPASDFQQ